MSGKVLQAIDIKNVLINAIGGILIGSVLLFVPMNLLLRLIMVVMGCLLLCVNGFNLYKKTADNAASSNEMLLDVLGVLAGFFLLTSSNLVMIIILSIYLIANPIIRLYLVKFDKSHFMIELPKLLLGVILLLCGISTFNILFKILGGIVVGVSLVYLAFNYYLYKKSGIKIIK